MKKDLKTFLYQLRIPAEVEVVEMVNTLYTKQNIIKIKNVCITLKYFFCDVKFVDKL